MSNPWFRMYSEFAGDPVVQSLAFEDQRHYVVLLCLKCSGTLDRNLPPTRRDTIIARGLGLDPASSMEARRRLMEVGLVDKSWQPVAWDKRQFVSDSSTVRVRKFRNNKETRNVTETHGNSFSNAPEQNRTDTDTDTNTSKNTNSTEPQAAAVPSGISIPLVDKSAYQVSTAQIEEWSHAYPAVDVTQQLRNMRQWSIANPKKRKTSRGVLRFIVSWLTREQDKPHFDGGNHATRQPIDNSAVGKVRRANEERERRAADAVRQTDGAGVGADGEHVRPPLDQ